jgi:hypothetical protein
VGELDEIIIRIVTRRLEAVVGHLTGEDLENVPVAIELRRRESKARERW